MDCCSDYLIYDDRIVMELTKNGNAVMPWSLLLLFVTIHTASIFYRLMKTCVHARVRIVPYWHVSTTSNLDIFIGRTVKLELNYFWDPEKIYTTTWVCHLSPEFLFMV